MAIISKKLSTKRRSTKRSSRRLTGGGKKSGSRKASTKRSIRKVSARRSYRKVSTRRSSRKVSRGGSRKMTGGSWFFSRKSNNKYGISKNRIKPDFESKKSFTTTDISRPTLSSFGKKQNSNYKNQQLANLKASIEHNAPGAAEKGAEVVGPRVAELESMEAQKLPTDKEAAQKEAEVEGRELSEAEKPEASKKSVNLLIQAYSELPSDNFSKLLKELKSNARK